MSVTHGELPKLFGLEYSVYTRIVRLVLEEKSIGYQLIETDVFANDFDHDSYTTQHPFGKIPVLQQGDFTLYETAAICRYLDATFPGIALQPANLQNQGVMHQIIGLLDNYAYTPLVWGVFVELLVNPREAVVTDNKKVEISLQQARVVLRELQRFLHTGNQFLAGKQLSLADLHALPILTYFALTPQGTDMLAAHPALSDWLVRMRERRSFLTTRSIYE